MFVHPGTDHPPPCGAEVKERVEIYVCSTYGPLWPVSTVSFAFIEMPVDRDFRIIRLRIKQRYCTCCVIDAVPTGKSDCVLFIFEGFGAKCP